MDVKGLERMAVKLRRHVVRMIANARSGHPAGALGLAEVFSVLFFRVLRLFPDDPFNPGRDFFYLSNGHVCAVFYAALAERGFFDVDELLTFRLLNSRLQGHPHNLVLPGVENSSGPLAQGFSQAVGAAFGLRLQRRRNRVFLVVGDGEHDEGQLWEAVLFAGHYKLDNLVVVLDRNDIQIDGFTRDVMNLEPLRAKYEAFNWRVFEVDGHDVSALISVFGRAVRVSGPVLVVAKTVPGKGVSFMENKPEWHGRPLSSGELEVALRELGGVDA